MKKVLTFLFAGLLLANLSFAQTVILNDDFESYTVGQNISTSDYWTTWSSNTGDVDDAQVTDAFNHTAAGSKSLAIVANDDIVHFFGDLSSGVYQVDFYYYVESGDGGYFNIEHIFGAQWAFEAYFNNGGNGTLEYNGTTGNFSFPQDQWFLISMYINLDDDQITLTINETYTQTWQFSLSSDGNQGQNILDCIDFYGATNAGTPNYYVDDFTVTEVVSGTDPQEISVNLTEITSDGTAATLTITNEGQDDLAFEAYAYYPEEVVKNVSPFSNNYTETKVINLGRNININELHIPVNIDSKDVTLTHLTGDIASSVGWNAEVTIHAAALFDHEMIKNYIGMEVSNVIIYCGNLPINQSAVEVYEGFSYTNGGPIDLISSENFTPVEANQTTVTLTSPAFVNGKDLWVGWTFTDPGANYYCLAVDAGPATPDVNFVRQGVAWSAMNEYGNMGIVAILTGTAMTPWLTLNVTEGVVEGGNTQDIQVGFNTTGLAPDVYECVLVVDNNDADESWTEIPVTLDLIGSTNETENISIATYPNPAKDYFNIIANENIVNVKIYTITGQLVNNYDVNSNTFKVNTSDLQSGVYMFEINTETQSVTKNIVIE